MKLSIVSTLYESSTSLGEFVRRSAEVANTVAGEDYELILVDDGSPDDSLEKALELMKSNNSIKVIELSRNFGHHNAIMSGLSYAKGDYVFLVDSDLEEQPEWLAYFHSQIQEGCDVVYGIQASRKGRRFERVSGQIFYRLLNLLSGRSLPENPTVARLMTRDYVESLLLHKERDLYIGGLMHLTGYDQVSVPVDKVSISPTTYTLRRKLAMLANSVTSLSYKPLWLVFYVGVAISLVSFAAVSLLIIQAVFIDRPLAGWTSIMASIWITCGLLMSSMGVIGIYLSKIFSEVKARPRTIIKKVHKSDHED